MTELKFESRVMKINNKINAEVEKIRADGDFELPKINAPLVDYYVQKIEGDYDVDRAKEDTDSAVDLLYIAYNTTPQEEGDIRVKISTIMSKLIRAQQESERTMKGALRVADSILASLDDFLPDWLDIKDANLPDKIKDFVVKDLRELANEIKERAEGVQDDLKNIADTYQTIIKDTEDATSNSELALTKRLKKKKEIENEINEAKARSAELQAIVQDLQSQVTKYEKMARHFESRAETAEDREFIMSIVSAVTDTLSTVLPAVAMPTSGSGILAASTINTGNQANDGGTNSDNTEEVIRTTKEIPAKQGELEESQKKIDDLEGKIKDLEKQKAELVEATDEDEKDLDEENAEGGAETNETTSAVVAELDKKIKTETSTLTTEKENHSEVKKALDELKKANQDALNAQKKNLSEMTDKHKAQSTSLREMQMKMLDKVESFENARRTQAAELIKIKSLMIGKRTEEETIKLAIQAMNVSLSALKRAKEIIVELEAFFRSFAAFMEQISDEATQRVKSIDKTANKDELGKRRLAKVILWTDDFFIKQTGEWNAVTVVSDKFARNFAHGWSKLNKLSGTYISGDKLEAYLKVASIKLEEIVAERLAASETNIIELNNIRDQISVNEAA